MRKPNASLICKLIPMDRFWIPPEGWHEPFSLHGEEARHCSRVMRKREGDWIEGFNGDGGWARGPITSVNRNSIDVAVAESGISQTLRPRIEIAVGIPKGKGIDLIVQKAVELGVSAIHPILSEQGMVKIPPSYFPKKKEKWERIALEACKQCGQNILPKISAPENLATYLSRSDHPSTKLVGALLPETKPMKAILSKIAEPDSVILLVGPEGDFSPNEYAEIQSKDFLPVSLGGLTLRVETAILTMVSSVRYQFPC